MKEVNFGEQPKEAQKALKISSRKFKDKINYNKQLRISESTYYKLRIYAARNRKLLAVAGDELLDKTLSLYE